MVWVMFSLSFPGVQLRPFFTGGHKNPQPGGLKFHKQKYNADGARVQFG